MLNEPFSGQSIVDRGLWTELIMLSAAGGLFMLDPASGIRRPNLRISHRAEVKYISPFRHFAISPFRHFAVNP